MTLDPESVFTRLTLDDVDYAYWDQPFQRPGLSFYSRDAAVVVANGRRFNRIVANSPIPGSDALRLEDGPDKDLVMAMDAGPNLRFIAEERADFVGKFSPKRRAKLRDALVTHAKTLNELLAQSTQDYFISGWYSQIHPNLSYRDESHIMHYLSRREAPRPSQPMQYLAGFAGVAITGGDAVSPLHIEPVIRSTHDESTLGLFPESVVIAQYPLSVPSDQA